LVEGNILKKRAVSIFRAEVTSRTQRDFIYTRWQEDKSEGKGPIRTSDVETEPDQCRDSKQASEDGWVGPVGTENS
jgi:hypothetical protein